MSSPEIPKTSNACRPLTTTVEATNEHGQHIPTPIAGEHPLTLYIDKREIVTLMTLGQAPEALALHHKAAEDMWKRAIKGAAAAELLRRRVEAVSGLADD